MDQHAAEVVAGLRVERRSSVRNASSCIPGSAIVSGIRVGLFVEFFDLLMGLRLDPGDVIPWAFEMGDDLIELHVKGRRPCSESSGGMKTIRRVAMLMAMLAGFQSR